MRRACILPLLLASLAIAQAEPATTQSTQPSTAPNVEISPEARQRLDRLKSAYAAPGPLRVEATIVGEFDVAGRQRTYQMQVVGQTDGEGRFDHQAKDIGRVVQTPEKVIIFDARRNAFANLTQKPQRRNAADFPEAVSEILIDENPSLLLTLTDEPDTLLTANVKRVLVRDDALVLESTNDLRTIQFDDLGLIRSMSIDFTPLLKERGALAIKKASVVLTYTRSDRTPPGADAFAFEVPKGASEFRLASELLRDRIEEIPGRLLPGGRATTPAAPTTQPATSD